MALSTRPRQHKPHGRHPQNALSVSFVRTVKEAGRYADGNGLYLEVKSTGTRSWIQRLTVRGRRRELGLGGFPLVSLAEARAEALANRKLARNGSDPLAEKQRIQGIPSFGEAAEQVWADKRPGWRHPRHAQDWITSLQRHVLPHIGRFPVNELTSADVLRTLRRIWHVRPETARRIRQRISAIMEWTIVMRYRDDNPCDRLGLVLGPQQDMVQHMPALPHAQVAGAIRTIQMSRATRAVKLAFEFMVLTASRPGEVRGALWAEIDQETGVWTIPPTRMKARRRHRVPLGGRSAEILKEARKLDGGHRPLVFPSQDGKPICETRLPRLLAYHKIGAVPHGFRSSFRDWAAEKTNHPREVVEAALAHAVGSRVEAAYARSDLFDRRQRLMADWDAYLNTPRAADRTGDSHDGSTDDSRDD